MAFSDQEKIQNSDKLSLQISGTADTIGSGGKFWYNELFRWVPQVTPDKQLGSEFLLIPPADNQAQADNAVASFPTVIQKVTLRLTVEPTSNFRTYVARQVYNDNTSNQLENWIQPALVRSNGGPSNGYIIRLYHGDPGFGGVQITTAQQSGAGGAPAWKFDYSGGLLKVSTDQTSYFSTAYNTNGLWITGYRYIGNFGAGGSTTASLRLEKAVTQPAHGLSVGDIVYLDDADGLYKKALANQLDTLGFLMVVLVPDANNFTVTFIGYVSGLPGPFNTGEYYYLSDTVPGTLVATAPAIQNPLFFADTSTSGFFIPWRPSDTTGAGPGPGTTTAANVGTGEQIYKNQTGNILNFKTLKAGPGVTMNSTADEVTITASGSIPVSHTFIVVNGQANYVLPATPIYILRVVYNSGELFETDDYTAAGDTITLNNYWRDNITSGKKLKVWYYV